MTPLFFDLIIIALLLVSAGLGFLRGFCNEVFTIFGWMGAVIATIYFTPVLREHGRDLIEKKWLADIATAGAIFLVTLGVFSAVSHFATRTLQASKLNIVDRGLGFGFGVLRGVLLLGLSFYLFASVVFTDPEQRPDFVREARTLPFLEASASWAEIFLPKDMKEKTEESLDKLAEMKEEKQNETSVDDVIQAKEKLQTIIDKNVKFDQEEKAKAKEEENKDE